MILKDDWAKKRPYMLMMHIDDWSKVKKSWLKACRAFRDNCNIVVDSIDSSIIKLDQIIRDVTELTK